MAGQPYTVWGWWPAMPKAFPIRLSDGTKRQCDAAVRRREKNKKYQTRQYHAVCKVFPSDVTPWEFRDEIEALATRISAPE